MINRYRILNIRTFFEFSVSCQARQTEQMDYLAAELGAWLGTVMRAGWASPGLSLAVGSLGVHRVLGCPSCSETRMHCCSLLHRDALLQSAALLVMPCHRVEWALLGTCHAVVTEHWPPMPSPLPKSSLLSVSIQY